MDLQGSVITSDGGFQIVGAIPPNAIDIGASAMYLRFGPLDRRGSTCEDLQGGIEAGDGGFQIVGDATPSANSPYRIAAFRSCRD